LIIKALWFSSRKYPYSLHRRDWNFLGGGEGEFSKIKTFKKLSEFPEGWGMGRYEYFLELHISKRHTFLSLLPHSTKE